MGFGFWIFGVGYSFKIQNENNKIHSKLINKINLLENISK